MQYPQNIFILHDNSNPCNQKLFSIGELIAAQLGYYLPITQKIFLNYLNESVQEPNGTKYGIR
ncbi:hypothetical protein EDD73_1091 [Heliophilum fasciatum]|uniref:Uncharacterized protein n=1 Tax=Heliophilum fasciatum TaxID=35700 RepID=A0A4R2RKP0_9FIRM|nr:hypothetical protein [Heliophilum fasciatum]TCP64460.1 hypothetical protein EDD73_1091 [Heliophilum fasciatum]